MLVASKKIDYGILLMANLPEKRSKRFRSIHDIAKQNNLSAGYLGQLMIPLKKAGLVRSREGLHGGYQLAHMSEKISIKDIVTALEGPLALTSCLGHDESCKCEKDCSTKNIWSELQQLMSHYMGRKMLSEFRSPFLIT